MKKIFAFIASALMLASCNESNIKKSTECIDADKAITDVIMSRRSIRVWKDSTISRETMDEILKCGINAPNGRNSQSYEIRVLSSAMIDSFTAAVVKDNPQIAEKGGFKNIFVNAPHVICLAYDKSYDMAQVDCGLLAENIMLSAWSKGIGSCCLGSSARWMKESASAKPFLNKLAFSDGYEFLFCIGLGYPDETPDAKPRRDDMIKYVD